MVGSAFDTKRGHVTEIFRNEINAVRDARSGVNVARDFTVISDNLLSECALTGTWAKGEHVLSLEASVQRR